MTMNETGTGFKTYTGTKTVKATPMGVGEARRYGANITEETANANLGNDGYLVDYPDGYRSWCPKKTFDAAYRISESYTDRLRIEHEDLKARYLKGQEFVYSEAFDCLDKDERDALTVQMDLMRNYLSVLAARIKYAEEKERRMMNKTCDHE